VACEMRSQQRDKRQPTKPEVDVAWSSQLEISENRLTQQSFDRICANVSLSDGLDRCLVVNERLKGLAECCLFSSCHNRTPAACYPHPRNTT
jgi:hypothetical protein